MPSVAGILFALHAAVLIAIFSTPFISTYAAASPLPSDYSFNNFITSRTYLPFRKNTFKGMKNPNNDTEMLVQPRLFVAESSPMITKSPRSRRSDLPSGQDHLNLLDGYYTQLDDHAKNLKSLAARSASVKGNDYDFQQECAYELTGFHVGLLGFQTILAQLDADRGLSNYDHNNDLEVLVKNSVNAIKNALGAVDVLIFNIPLLGPILGPIIYEIKCLLDDILDTVENVTDGLLNTLLQPLIEKAAISACKSGIHMPGLCL